MPRGPYDLKLGKAKRKDLTRRLRDLLAHRQADMREMVEALAVEPEVVVVALRELRSRRGQVRSAIRFGHVAWWWVPPSASPSPAPDADPRAGKDTKKKDKKHKKKEAPP